MCCDLAESVGSQDHWLWDTARKIEYFCCFLLFWESLTCYNFGTTGLIQVRFSAQCTSSNEHFNWIKTENVTFDFRLMSLDYIYWGTQTILSLSLWLYRQNIRTYRHNFHIILTYCEGQIIKVIWWKQHWKQYGNTETTAVTSQQKEVLIASVKTAQFVCFMCVNLFFTFQNVYENT